MTDREKLKLLQTIGNEVVDNLQALTKATKALEIVLGAMGARDKPVTVEAMGPEYHRATVKPATAQQEADS